MYHIKLKWVSTDLRHKLQKKKVMSFDYASEADHEESVELVALNLRWKDKKEVLLGSGVILNSATAQCY